jgi:hypothetical protein
MGVDAPSENRVCVWLSSTTVAPRPHGTEVTNCDSERLEHVASKSKLAAHPPASSKARRQQRNRSLLRLLPRSFAFASDASRLKTDSLRSDSRDQRPHCLGLRTTEKHQDPLISVPRSVVRGMAIMERYPTTRGQDRRSGQTARGGFARVGYQTKKGGRSRREARN